MKKFTKKPEILKKKVQLAEMLRAHPSFIEGENYGMDGYYWRGEIEIFDKKIAVYLQRYTKIRSGVDYVHLHWMPEHKSLTPKDVRELIEKIESQ